VCVKGVCVCAGCVKVWHVACGRVLRGGLRDCMTVWWTMIRTMMGRSKAFNSSRPVRVLP
jgi:hypothetical protein